MSNPELIAGKWVERRGYVGGTNACGRCAFAKSTCRITRHEGRTIRSLCDGIYFIEVKEPEIMPYPYPETEPTPLMPPVVPVAPTLPKAEPAPAPTLSAKQLAEQLVELSKAEEALTKVRKLHEWHAIAPANKIGINLKTINSNGKVILRNRVSDTTTDVDSVLLRQAFEVHQDAILQTLLDLHTQQVAEMKRGLSESLLDTAVEYRK